MLEVFAAFFTKKTMPSAPLPPHWAWLKVMSIPLLVDIGVLYKTNPVLKPPASVSRKAFSGESPAFVTMDGVKSFPDTVHELFNSPGVAKGSLIENVAADAGKAKTPTVINVAAKASFLGMMILTLVCSSKAEL
jgi:hypothetical protein